MSAHRDNTIKVGPSKGQCHMFFGADKVAVGWEELPYHKRFLPMNSAAGYHNQVTSTVLKQICSNMLLHSVVQYIKICSHLSINMLTMQLHMCIIS